ncbi:hypothetical protein FB451DRAFT_1556924 [Mycena latifolia]|nr:hypothetical protein FB451DRAFT_1556924 [Mycena latifolia]
MRTPSPTSRPSAAAAPTDTINKHLKSLFFCAPTERPRPLLCSISLSPVLPSASALRLPHCTVPPTATNSIATQTCSRASNITPLRRNYSRFTRIAHSPLIR